MNKGIGRIVGAVIALGLPICAFLCDNAIAQKPKAKPTAQPTRIISDPRGQPELIVCSQNLENYGELIDVKSRQPKQTKSGLEAKLQALVQRFSRAKCDAIAVQEVVGKNEYFAAEILKKVAAELSKQTGRVFDAKVGKSNDKLLHNGFLIARDRASIQNTATYANVELPRLTPGQKPRKFSRGPFEIQLLVKGKDASSPKVVSLVTYHFKSQSGSARDPAEAQWETARMEMAEALRRIVENRHARSFASDSTILVVLGDRNSNFDTAGARILEGSLTLGKFQNDAACRLSKLGAPLCRAGSYAPQRLFSVLTSDPQTRARSGTFKIGKGQEYVWIDDIMLPSESLRFAKHDPYKEGDFASFVLNTPPGASDHALVGVKLNW